MVIICVCSCRKDLCLVLLGIWDTTTLGSTARPCHPPHIEQGVPSLREGDWCQSFSRETHPLPHLPFFIMCGQIFSTISLCRMTEPPPQFTYQGCYLLGVTALCMGPYLYFHLAHLMSYLLTPIWPCEAYALSLQGQVCRYPRQTPPPELALHSCSLLCVTSEDIPYFSSNSAMHLE